MTIQWNTIVGYDKAVDLLSTDQRLTRDGWTAGRNAQPHLDALTSVQCIARAQGAWNSNLRDQYVAYISAAKHKGWTEPTYYDTRAA